MITKTGLESHSADDIAELLNRTARAELLSRGSSHVLVSEGESLRLRPHRTGRAIPSSNSDASVIVGGWTMSAN